MHDSACHRNKGLQTISSIEIRPQGYGYSNSVGTTMKQNQNVDNQLRGEKSHEKHTMVFGS